MGRCSRRACHSLRFSTPTLPISPPRSHPQTFAAINQDGWSSVQALRACVGNSSADLPSDILDTERRGERGTATESEARRRRRHCVA